MKTKIVCPNKSDPAWEILVEAIGEPRAYLSFFRCGNSIPDVATALKLLWAKKRRAKPQTHRTVVICKGRRDFPSYPKLKGNI